MAEASWERPAEIQQALRTIVSDPRLGVPALSDPQAMARLVKDLLPSAPREASVLVAAAGAGVAQLLRDRVAQGMDLAAASTLAASTLADRAALMPEACSWAVDELTVALGFTPGGEAPGHAVPQWALPTGGVAGPAGAAQAKVPVAAGSEAPANGSHPSRAKAPWRKRALILGAVLAVAAGAGIIPFLAGHPVAKPGAEPLSKIIRPDVETRTCRAASTLGMAGAVKALSCQTKDPVISLNGYQFANTPDFRQALSHMNVLINWYPILSSRYCPAGAGSGRQLWHTAAKGRYANPQYRTQRPDQILECVFGGLSSEIKFAAGNQNDNGDYMWTLPTKRVILLAHDSGDTFTESELPVWWESFIYG